MNSDSSSRSRDLARIGLLLEPSVPVQGDPPGTDELWDWMHGFVGHDREAEILTHIASDDALYDQWQELREALSDEIAENAPDFSAQRVEGWASRLIRQLTGGFKPGHTSNWPTGAFSYVALVALIVLLVLPPPPIDPWQDWRTPKSTTDHSIAPETQQAMETVLSGVRAELTSRGLDAVGPQGAPLPDRAHDCVTTDQACISRDQALRHVGSLAITGLVECQGEKSVTVQGQSLTKLVRQFEDDPTLTSLLTPLRRWAAAEQGDSVTACAAISTLVSRALQVQRP